jgi:tetratricopeptide (TPR) repeat protein
VKDWSACESHIRISHFYALGADRARPVDDLKKLEPQYLDFLQHWPEWEGSYELVSGYELSIGNTARAISYGERASQMVPDGWINYRTLAIAYSMAGRHLDAAKAGDKAKALNKAVSGDTEFMLALAKSYAVLGDKETLKAILALLLHYHPDISKTKNFVDAMHVIHEHLKVSDTNR